MWSRRQFLAARIAAGEEWRRMIQPSGPYIAAMQAEALAAAEARIREIRMRDAAVDFGIPRAAVQAEQLRHAFPFGNQLWGIDADFRHQRWESPEAVSRRAAFARTFNAANALCYWTERPQNDAIKTEDRQGELKLDSFAACVAWAEANRLLVKGHPLYCRSPRRSPRGSLAMTWRRK
jgi:hypothetical protein